MQISEVICHLFNNSSPLDFLCTQDGFSPLYVACQKGYKDIVDTLLKSGANVNLATTVRMRVLFSDLQGFSYSEVVQFQ